ncbi:probable pectate lyase 12 [Tanacetum coccineum]
MAECRRGCIHVVNDVYLQWEMYAIGESGNPTINSPGDQHGNGDVGSAAVREYVQVLAKEVVILARHQNLQRVNLSSYVVIAINRSQGNVTLGVSYWMVAIEVALVGNEDNTMFAKAFARFLAYATFVRHKSLCRFNYTRRNAGWTPPYAAVATNFHLLMHKYEVKNIYSFEPLTIS